MARHTTRRDHFMSRQPRDTRADPWVNDAITRPPGTMHVYRAVTETEARDFRSAFYKACRHYGISCRADVVTEDAGWAVNYRVWPKHVGQAHIRAQKAAGRPLAYDKLTEETS